MANEKLNEKTREMTKFAAYIVANSCGAAQQNKIFDPEDMPNVFLACIIHMMTSLKNSCPNTKENQDILNVMAQNVVSGLVKSLEFNGFAFEATIPELNPEDVGIVVPDNVGRA